MMKYIVLLIYLLSVTTDINAKEHRSSSVKSEFQRQHPCPLTGKTRGTCPGWVKDHIKALSCGGADSPENMQWQTLAEANAKDKWERIGCPNQRR